MYILKINKIDESLACMSERERESERKREREIHTHPWLTNREHF